MKENGETEFFCMELEMVLATCVHIISARVEKSLSYTFIIIINAYVFALTDMHICLL